jgi:tetratricopeptide (TPR) repeat protein
VLLQSLDIGRDSLGDNHPQVAATLNNGDAAAAEAYYVEALAIAETAFGPYHPHTAKISYNLGILYNQMGRYEEAGPLLERSLEIREASLRPEHPMIAQSLEGYADMLRATNRASEADRADLMARSIRAQNPVRPL